MRQVRQPVGKIGQKNIPISPREPIMHILVLVTAGSKKEAQGIARALVKDKLAACVNILDNLKSLFWWEARIDTAKETLLLIKSKSNLLPQIIRKVKSLHSYEVPEIIALPIIGGEKKYLRWLNESVRKPR